MQYSYCFLEYYYEAWMFKILNFFPLFLDFFRNWTTVSYRRRISSASKNAWKKLKFAAKYRTGNKIQLQWQQKRIEIPC